MGQGRAFTMLYVDGLLSSEQAPVPQTYGGYQPAVKLEPEGVLKCAPYCSNGLDAHFL